MTLNEFLTSVADSIRAKKGTSEAIPAADFPEEIENLPTGSNIAYSKSKLTLSGSYGLRNGSLAFSELKSITMASIYGFYTSSYNNIYTIIGGTNFDGTQDTLDSNTNITISDNVVSFSSVVSTDSNITLYVTVAGEPA